MGTAERERVALPSLVTMVLAAALVWSFCTPVIVGDFGLHHRVGEWVLAHHAVPKAEFITFTAPGHPWVTQQWLSGLIFAVVDRWGGLTACFALGALVFTGTLAGLHRIGKEIGAEPMALALLVILAWGALGFYAGLRGSLFSHFLLVVELLLVDRLQRHPDDLRPLIAFPPLLALWIGLHGLFIVGVGLAGFAVVHWMAVVPLASRSRLDRVRLGILAGAATLAALLLQPHGVAGLVLPFRYLLGENETGLALLKQKVDEWRPLDLHTMLGGVWIAFALLAAACLARPRRLIARAPQMAIAVVFLLLTLKSKRHLPLGALALFPVACDALLVPLAGFAKKHPRYLAYGQLEAAPRKLAAGGIPWALAAAICVLFARSPGFDRYKLSPYPMAAIEDLAARPGGNVLVLYDWTGTVAWKAPAWRLFLHEDVTSYPRAVFEDWYAIINADPGWREKLDRYGVGAVLVPGTTAVADQLDDDLSWKVAFQDSSATLFLRAAPLQQ